MSRQFDYQVVPRAVTPCVLDLDASLLYANRTWLVAPSFMVDHLEKLDAVESINNDETRVTTGVAAVGCLAGVASAAGKDVAEKLTKDRNGRIAASNVSGSAFDIAVAGSSGRVGRGGSNSGSQCNSSKGELHFESVRRFVSCVLGSLYVLRL